MAARDRLKKLANEQMRVLWRLGFKVTADDIVMVSEDGRVAITASGNIRRNPGFGGIEDATVDLMVTADLANLAFKVVTPFIKAGVTTAGDVIRAASRPSVGQIGAVGDISGLTEREIARTTVPTVEGGFAEWFNNLSADSFDALWSNPEIREIIKRRLRSPGGQHEWLMVGRANIFKRWGLTAEQIWAMRTLTSELRFINPAGRHGASGSGTAHKEIMEMVDSSTSFEQFRRRLQTWANYRLEGGVEALPASLR